MFDKINILTILKNENSQNDQNGQNECKHTGPKFKAGRLQLRRLGTHAELPFSSQIKPKHIKKPFKKKIHQSTIIKFEVHLNNKIKLQ